MSATSISSDARLDQHWSQAFRGKSTAVPLYIVLPDHQQWACTALDEQLRAQGYRVRTAGQLMDEVGRETRKTR